MGNNVTRLQHFVPREHIRPFDSDGDECVCVFNKVDGLIKTRMPIGAICAENWMYESPRLPTNFVEKKVTHRIENAFWPIRDRILEGSVEALSPSDRKMILRYVTFQDVRTRSSFAHQEQVSNYLMDLINEVGASRRFGMPTDDRDARELARHAYLSSISGDQLPKSMSHLTLRIVRSASRSFVLGDDPVFRDNPTFSAAWGRWNGYRSPGVEVFMPISPKIGILAFCTDTLQRLDQLCHGDPVKSGPGWSVWLEEDFQGYTLRGSHRMDVAREKCERYLRSGLVIDVDDVFVEEKNTAAVTFASRWIIGQTERDVELAKELAEKDPELAEPPVVDGEAIALRTLVPNAIDQFIKHSFPNANHGEIEILRLTTFERLFKPAMERLRERRGFGGDQELSLILRPASVLED